MYWKINEDKKFLSKEKLVSGALAAVITCTSVFGLINFIYQKITQESEW